MKKYSILITLFLSLTGFSQNYTGTLDTISKKGLHTILLTSKIRSATKENFNSLRIKDSQKNEVPYVLIHPRDKAFLNFVPKKITKKAIKDSVTSIIIENKTGKVCDYIALKIANTAITKRYTIYGSDDKKNWFGLVANKRISGLKSSNHTSVEKLISFPLNTYRFLRINFDDRYSLPINILEVGNYESQFFTQNPIEIIHFEKNVTQIKNRKVTQLKFTGNNTHKIDAISFDIKTEFFQRNAKILVKRTRKVKKRIETYNQVIANFQLSSKNKNTFAFNNLNEKEFIVEIDNQDNPALEIESVQLFQKPIYLVSNLKEKESYNLVIDSTYKKPSYDLGNFISDKTKTISKVEITNFSKVEKKQIFKEKSFWETNLFMWICILFGGIIVVYFTQGLLKDINKREEN